MDPKDEVGDDAEVAASPAAQRPEHVRVSVLIDGTKLPVCRGDPHREKVVQGQTKPTTSQTKAAAERDAGDTDRRTGTGGQGGAFASQRRGNVDQLTSRPDRGGSVALVDPDPIQPTQIEHDTVGERRIPGIAMAT